MNKQRVRLIDVLNPPANPWLREVSRGKIDLPAGVRIVRVCDDADDDQAKDALAASAARSAVSLRRSA